MLLDKRHLTSKVLNGGGMDSPSLFYISNANGLPTTGSVGSGMIAMQSPTTTPLSSAIITTEYNTAFNNPLATTSNIKYEPAIPMENSIVSLNHINSTPVVPPPGQHPYSIDTSSKIPPPQTLPMQIVQTTTINPNGMNNESNINPPVQYQAQIPQPSHHQQLPESKNIQQISVLLC